MLSQAIRKGFKLSYAPRVALAANRKIGVQSLRLLLEHQVEPVALLVPKGKNVDPSVQELQDMLPQTPVLHGKEFREAAGVAMLDSLRLDYLLSVHFPYIITQGVLDIPRVGTLNLHPAYLPFNRGWHTPSWAILEGTPYGATLHWVDEGTDTGAIALQRAIDIRYTDTADTLYARVLTAELELLRKAIPLLKTDALPCEPQRGRGSEHLKSDLRRVRRLNLDERLPVREVLRRLRALTTNREAEAAWFEIDGQRYLVQIAISQDRSAEPRPQLRIHKAA